MVVPVILLMVSLAGLGGALIVPGLSDLVLVAGPCVLASLWLLVQIAGARAASRSVGPQIPKRSPTFNPPQGPHPAKLKWILVDGSNVMYWKGGTPQIDTLRQVVGHLTARGFTPAVVFDANAGYLVSGKYQHDGALGLLLGLPEERVMVVGKGSPADTILLAAARHLGARIVSNDRYRDWADTHPEVREPGYVIRGGFRDTGLWLDLKES